VEDFLGSRHAATPQRTDYQRQSVSIVANFAALRGRLFGFTPRRYAATHGLSKAIGFNRGELCGFA
jgi:hypothetical protein